MVTFAQNWQDAAAPGLPADHDRFESVDENETFLNLGGFRRRGARCCVVVSREEEGSRMLPSARCYVDVPVPDWVGGFLEEDVQQELNMTTSLERILEQSFLLSQTMPAIRGAVANRRKRLQSSHRQERLSP